MIRTDVNFINAVVFDISRFHVQMGQSFGLHLYSDVPLPLGEKLSWFFDNDPVLDISVTSDGFSAVVSAINEGVSTVLIMDSNRKVVKELTIGVVLTVLPPADTLSPTAEVLPK